MGTKCNSCKEKSNCRDVKTCNIVSVNPEVNNVLAIMSGKGGVGKSTVSSTLAVALADKGYQVGILDGDITGPSIPRLFGIEGRRALKSDQGFLPVETRKGIKVISLNLLLAVEDEPAIWRGPVLAATIKQFWEKVHWGALDLLIIDLPPGTGDVPLTVMQSLPIKGLVMVSSPQSLVAMIVKKGIGMANRMKTPVLGLIENMSYIRCPDCGKVIHLFGESELPEICAASNIDLLGNLPLDIEFVKMTDAGQIEAAYDQIEEINKRMGIVTQKIIEKINLV